FAGGTALNCSANDRLLRESPFEGVFIPPASSDAGTSLGCALYGLTELAGARCEYRWQHDYLGPEISTDDVERALRDVPDIRIDTPLALPDVIAALLCQGDIVALYQGRSESGGP